MMNRRKARRLFDPDRLVYARVLLKLRGEVYRTGDVLPWKEIGVPQSIAESLFRHRRISHFASGDLSQEAKTEYSGVRSDGPTIETWIATGYPATAYPPSGYVAIPSPGLTAFMETGEVPEELVAAARTAYDKIKTKRARRKKS